MMIIQTRKYNKKKDAENDRDTQAGENFRQGDYSIVWFGCSIGNNVTIGDLVIVRENCVIGDHVTIGDSSYIGPGVTIKKGKNIPPFSKIMTNK